MFGYVLIIINTCSMYKYVCNNNANANAMMMMKLCN